MIYRKDGKLLTCSGKLRASCCETEIPDEQFLDCSAICTEPTISVQYYESWDGTIPDPYVEDVVIICDNVGGNRFESRLEYPTFIIECQVYDGLAYWHCFHNGTEPFGICSFIDLIPRYTICPSGSGSCSDSSFGDGTWTIAWEIL